MSGLSVLPIKPFPLIPLAAAALWGAAASAQSPAPYKPNKKDDASRHDVASSVDKSRPLLHPVTCDKCMAKGVPVITRQEIYREGWIDLNKNGTKEACEDASQPVKKRVGDLLARMTRQERTMRLVALCGYNQATPDYLPSTAWLNELHKDGIANIDEHLGGFSWFENEAAWAWLLRHRHRCLVGGHPVRGNPHREVKTLKSAGTTHPQRVSTEHQAAERAEESAEPGRGGPSNWGLQASDRMPDALKTAK